jgi:hypothetical protein
VSLKRRARLGPDRVPPFSKDCIIAWLAKKDEPKCPICRQAFCVLDNVPEFMPEPSPSQQHVQQHLQGIPYSFSQSLSRALAMSRLEAAALEQQQQNNNNNNESTNRATIPMNLRSVQQRQHGGSETPGSTEKCRRMPREMANSTTETVRGRERARQKMCW